MKRLLLAADVIALDQAAVSHGVPVLELMENAGRALADFLIGRFSEKHRFVVLAGRGNNGGDGLVAARLLLERGRRVEVVSYESGTPRSPACQKNFERLRPLAAPKGIDAVIPHADDVLVDAIVGSGLRRALEDRPLMIIDRVRAWKPLGAPCVAVDIASGLSSDTGLALGAAVSADMTVTFAAMKAGHVLQDGPMHSGEVYVADIGLPNAAWLALRGPHASLVEEADAIARLPVRTATSHKGTYGHVLVVAGSPGTSGAATLASYACLRAGAGLVSVASREAVVEGVVAKVPEVMSAALEGTGPLSLQDRESLLPALEDKSSAVFGPGMGRGSETKSVLVRVLGATTLPFVFDADALSAFGTDPSPLSRFPHRLILTPHPGEAARLLGMTAQQVNEDRLAAARKLASMVQNVVVLKGAKTIVALADGTAYVNPTGNAGMATGGTGDVLAGLCGALLAQGLSLEDAALVAVYAHGLAGDLAAQRKGQMGLIASDLIESLPEVWTRWHR